MEDMNLAGPETADEPVSGKCLPPRRAKKNAKLALKLRWQTFETHSTEDVDATPVEDDKSVAVDQELGDFDPKVDSDPKADSENVETFQFLDGDGVVTENQVGENGGNAGEMVGGNASDPRAKDSRFNVGNDRDTARARRKRKRIAQRNEKNEDAVSSPIAQGDTSHGCGVDSTGTSTVPLELAVIEVETELASASADDKANGGREQERGIKGSKTDPDRSQQTRKKTKKQKREEKRKCVFCRITFSTRQERDLHIRVEHREKNCYPCYVCGRVFGESSHCKRHLISHTGEKRYSCSICNKEFADNSYIRRHMLIHTGHKPFQCDQCGKTFREKTHLTRHEETHKKEGDVCSTCGKTLYGSENRCSCSQRIKSIQDNFEKRKKSKNFVCEECGKGFAKYGNYHTHMEKHKKGPLPQLPPVSCNVCNREFKLKRNLVRHLLIHSGEKPYRCPECGKMFRDASYVKRHMLIHTGQRPFQCDICKSTFRESGHLARHMPTHTGEKRFNCAICGKGYQDKICLLRHEATCIPSAEETDGKIKVLCDICGKEYSGRASLLRHKRAHTGQKNFQCAKCPAKFFDKACLQRHSSIHDRDPKIINQCPICQKLFRTRRTLDRHMATHAAKPVDKFECRLCDEEFQDHAALTSHAASHQGEFIPLSLKIVEDPGLESPAVQVIPQALSIDLECKICHKLFASPSILANHEITHAQSLLGEALRPTAITVASTSQKPAASAEVMMPSGLMDTPSGNNTDDFAGLFKLLQVIAHVSQSVNQVITQAGSNVTEDSKGDVMPNGVGRTTSLEKRKDIDAPVIVKPIPAIDDPSQLQIDETAISSPDGADDNESFSDDTIDNISSWDVDDPPFDGGDLSDDYAEELSCQFCNFVCRRDEELATHLAREHPSIVFARRDPLDSGSEEEDKNLQWQCPYCNEVFDIKNLKGKEHDCKGVKEKPHQCPHCPSSFAKKSVLNNHMKVHHERDPNFKCSFCGKAFHFKNSLEYHERIHTNERPFVCKVCGKGFKDKSHLRRHEKIHEDVKPYACKICPKKFLERSQLVKHGRVHSGEKPYLCSHCGKSFADASHLRRHTNLHKTKRERKFKCPECGKGFLTSDSLRAHQKLHNRTLPCDVCGKEFPDAGNLKRHKACHSKERPYSCRICSKEFRIKLQLKKHFKVHTGEKPFPCHMCNRRFTDSAQLKRHVATAHPPDKEEEEKSKLSFCYVCGEAFTESDLLKKHMEGHSNEANPSGSAVVDISAP